MTLTLASVLGEKRDVCLVVQKEERAFKAHSRLLLHAPLTLANRSNERSNAVELNSANCEYRTYSKHTSSLHSSQHHSGKKKSPPKFSPLCHRKILILDTFTYKRPQAVSLKTPFGHDYYPYCKLSQKEQLQQRRRLLGFKAFMHHTLYVQMQFLPFLGIICRCRSSFRHMHFVAWQQQRKQQQLDVFSFSTALQKHIEHNRKHQTRFVTTSRAMCCCC